MSQVTGDRTPVLILDWAAGDFLIPAFYQLQYRAVEIGDPTRVEKYPIIDLEILPRVGA
jgi:hypothetical protein